MRNLRLKIFILRKFGGKDEILITGRKFATPVRILSKICRICEKIATLCPAYFF